MARSELKFRAPMLAREFDPELVEFPCYAQPKLDGIRCITDGWRFWSRNGKLFPEANTAHLRTPVRLPYLVDGELMVLDKAFEDIVRAVKRHKSAGNEEVAKHLKLCVFDVVTDEPFHDRRITARTIAEQAKSWGAKWKPVQTVKVENRIHLKQLARAFLQSGYEGTMVRSANGLYQSKRVNDLLKWKPLLDDEFAIVGFVEAKGKDKGTPVFICRVGRGAKNTTFRVRPMGTIAQRRKMWRDRKDLIGAMLTVEYQNFTKHGKPRHPRAKVLRDYE